MLQKRPITSQVTAGESSDDPGISFDLCVISQGITLWDRDCGKLLSSLSPDMTAQRIIWFAEHPSELTACRQSALRSEYGNGTGIQYWLRYAFIIHPRNFIHRTETTYYSQFFACPSQLRYARFLSDSHITMKSVWLCDYNVSNFANFMALCKNLTGLLFYCCFAFIIKIE